MPAGLRIATVVVVAVALIWFTGAAIEVVGRCVSGKITFSGF